MKNKIKWKKRDTDMGQEYFFENMTDEYILRKRNEGGWFIRMWNVTCDEFEYIGFTTLLAKSKARVEALIKIHKEG